MKLTSDDFVRALAGLPSQYTHKKRFSKLGFKLFYFKFKKKMIGKEDMM